MGRFNSDIQAIFSCFRWSHEGSMRFGLDIVGESALLYKCFLYCTHLELGTYAYMYAVLQALGLGRVTDERTMFEISERQARGIVVGSEGEGLLLAEPPLCVRSVSKGALLIPQPLSLTPFLYSLGRGCSWQEFQHSQF